MRLTIDTEKDSPEIIRRAIELLQLSVGLKTTTFQESSQSKAYPRMKPKDFLRQQHQQEPVFNTSSNQQNEVSPTPFSLFDEPTVKDVSIESNVHSAKPLEGKDMFQMFNHELPSSEPEFYSSINDSNSVLDRLSEKEKKETKEFYEIEPY